MNKYLHVFFTGIQSTLTYRFNYLFRAVFGLVPLAGTLFVWKAIYAEKGDGAAVSGYTLGGMISYYLLLTVVDALTAVAEDDWQIASDIREGSINQFLLKPLDYLSYRLSLYAAGRVIYTSCALAPVVVVGLWLWPHLVLPSDFVTMGAFLLSLSLAALLQFFIAYTMALLAFWVLDVSTFIFIQFALEYIASGHLFPLDVLPPALNRVIHFTPYPYLLFFPVSVGLNRVRGGELALGLLIQLMWVLLGLGMARWVWSRGIRKYAAFGG